MDYNSQSNDNETEIYPEEPTKITSGELQNMMSSPKSR